MEKQYKIHLPKGKKVTMTNVDFENGVMTVNVELENREEQKYEPKDGDFVQIRANIRMTLTDIANVPIIFICKSIEGNIIDYYADNVYGEKMDNTFYYLDDITEIRPATEEEKKLLIDKLAERNKKWNAETKQIENVRWRAKGGEKYYFVKLSDKNFPILDTFDDSYSDIERYKIGNYFKTKESAERVAKQIQEIFKNSKTK